MELIIGGFYRHKEYHSFIKVEKFTCGYFRGIGFHRNETKHVGIGDVVILEPWNYIAISKTEYHEELIKIHEEILKRLFKK